MTQTTKTINAPKRDAALDATRTVAILLMIACHVARLIPKSFYRLLGYPQTENHHFIGLKNTFNRANADEKRNLNIEEFSSLFPQEDPDVLAAIFSDVDTNNSGYVLYSELYNAMTTFLLRPTWLQFSLDIEPLCQALFLGMVGVSLVYSMRIAARKGEVSWGGRQFRRAIELYLIGMIFFLCQYGWQFPWLFIGHGILLTISIAILFWLPLVRRDIGLYVSMVIGSLLAIIAIILDLNNNQFELLNAGNGPVFPHIILTSFGVICAYILLDGGKTHKAIFLLAITGCVIYSFFHGNFMELFDYPFGRKDFKVSYQLAGTGPEQIWKLIAGGELPIKPKEYYNYRPGLAPMLMALCTGIYLLFKLLGPITQKLTPLWSIGRHSLGVYILHLILVALTTIVFGSQKPFETSLEVNLCFWVITLICYGYAFWKERKKKKPMTSSIDLSKKTN